MTQTQSFPGTIAEHREITECTATLDDGIELFYRAWHPTEPSDKIVFLFHRGHEHSGRFVDVVERLGLNDATVFAWDARGHGRSPGDRGYAPSFTHMVRDVDGFVRHVLEKHGGRMENVVVIAHSVGAVALTAWVHDYAPRIRALVLVTPALRVKLYVPLAIPGLRLLQAIKRGKKSFIKSYVKAKMLTHDPEQAKRYDEDPLIARSIAVNILLGLHDASSRLIDDAGAITVPTLLLGAGSDWVVHLNAQRRFFDRLGARYKKMRVFKGMYHDVLHEKDRQPVLDEIASFITEVFDRKDDEPLMLKADQRGYTKDEYDRLSAPINAWSPKGLNLGFQRLAMKTIGRLSLGIRIGWQTGFDSGQSLDYVYENKARGTIGLGKLIDWQYLNAVGWKGIRIRKENIERRLHQAMSLAEREHGYVRLLDIAAGCGRYALEVLRTSELPNLSAVLRDHTEANLEAGRALAQSFGLTDVAFEQGDAFDLASLASMAPKPNVAVVSGLYELFPDNEMVLRSLTGLAEGITAGGYLIYTGQPWHPQVEMIARVLTNRDGDPWVMRRRTQREMDDLVHFAGFKKIAMDIDEYGIFTVSLARRI